MDIKVTELDTNKVDGRAYVFSRCDAPDQRWWQVEKRFTLRLANADRPTQPHALSCGGVIGRYRTARGGWAAWGRIVAAAESGDHGKASALGRDNLPEVSESATVFAEVGCR
jgi:hypothetical protein